MKRDTRRDDIGADLLREALEAETGTAGDGCLDAATVAAWADRRLGRRARLAVEAHAAGCARCQALVAAVAKTAPEEPRRGWWPHTALGWAIPAAVAVSAAAVVWTTAPSRRTSVPASDVGKQSRVADSAPLQTDPALVVPRRQLRTPPRQASPDVARPSAPSPSRTREDASAVTDALQPKGKQRPPDARKKADEQPALAEGAAASAENRGLEDRAADAPPPAAQAKPSPFGAPQAMLKSTAAGIVAPTIASPDPEVAWRLSPDRPGTNVERTTDGGRKWEVQHLPPDARVSAGTAPSADVCWLVGPAGTVVLTVDGGETWHRVVPPDTGDVVSVAAPGPDAATVTMADGRRFGTADRGRTWSAVK